MTNPRSLLLVVQLDAPLNQQQLGALSRLMTEQENTPCSVMWHDNGSRVGVSRSLPHGPWNDAITTAQAALERFTTVLAEQLGRRVDELVAVELLDADEAQRRVNQPSIPPLVNAERFAEILGVSRPRIYELAKYRRDGKRDDFPPEVVPGYWLESSAHAFARRDRKPGRPWPGRDS